MKLVFRVNPARLMGQNLGIDGDATARRYLNAFEQLIAERYPDVELDCGFGESTHRVVGIDPNDVFLRETEAIAYGLRKAGRYLVYA